jgi:hypothetical protein
MASLACTVHCDGNAISLLVCNGSPGLLQVVGCCILLQACTPGLPASHVASLLTRTDSKVTSRIDSLCRHRMMDTDPLNEAALSSQHNFCSASAALAANRLVALLAVHVAGPRHPARYGRPQPLACDALVSDACELCVWAKSGRNVWHYIRTSPVVVATSCKRPRHLVRATTAQHQAPHVSSHEQYDLSGCANDS